MEKQISIIIPTYNMEAYIGQCLDSLLIGEFDRVDVWVVNDGSKDRSSEIAHSYAERYPDSIHVVDKANGNYGSCINAALPLCTGRYVKVLDADDSFDTAAFAEFVALLPQCNEDAILTNFAGVEIEGNITKVCKNEYGLKHNISQPITELDILREKSYIQMHSITYRREIFKRFHYRQSEGISYTDVQWAIIPLAFCSTIKYLDLTVYRYLVGREGQTMDPAQLSRSIDQLFRVMADLAEAYRTCGMPTEIKEFIRSLIKDRHSYVYNAVLKYPSAKNMSILKNYDLELGKNVPELYEDINSIFYAPDIKYTVFRRLRKKDYPLHMSIPIKYRIEIFLKYRLGRR